VRYLPEYLWLGWSDHVISYPLELRTSAATSTIKQPSVIGRTTVTIGFIPDANSSYNYYRR
jgi:hypothetical protein